MASARKRRVIRNLQIMLALVPAVAVLTVAAPAQARASHVCIPVRADGAGQDNGQGPDGNLHTTATISVLGVVIGTTNATFTPDGPPTGTQLTFTGPIVFTPRAGSATLIANVVGSVDLAAGTFVASSTAVTGTGVLASVTGRLTFRGTENLSTVAFTETIQGRLCGWDAARRQPT